MAGSFEEDLTTGIQRSSEPNNGGMVTDWRGVFGCFFSPKKNCSGGWLKSSFYPRPFSIDKKYCSEILRLVKGILKIGGQCPKRERILETCPPLDKAHASLAISGSDLASKRRCPATPPVQLCPDELQRNLGPVFPQGYSSSTLRLLLVTDA